MKKDEKFYFLKIKGTDIFISLNTTYPTLTRDYKNLISRKTYNYEKIPDLVYQINEIIQNPTCGRWFKGNVLWLDTTTITLNDKVIKGAKKSDNYYVTSDAIDLATLPKSVVIEAVEDGNKSKLNNNISLELISILNQGEYYLAKDKDGTISLYSEKPVKDKNGNYKSAFGYLVLKNIDDFKDYDFTEPIKIS